MLPELQSVQGYQEEGCRSGKQTVGRQKPLTPPKGRAKKSNLLAPLQLERPSQSHPPTITPLPVASAAQSSGIHLGGPRSEIPGLSPLSRLFKPQTLQCLCKQKAFRETATADTQAPASSLAPPADPYPVSPQFLISSSQDGAMDLLLSLPFAITP